MKTKTSDKPLFKGFMDFTLFYVVPVRPGAVLTPSNVTRNRISPLHRRRRGRLSATWNTYYIHVPATEPAAPATPPAPDVPEETGVDDSWANRALRARKSWMDENEY